MNRFHKIRPRTPCMIALHTGELISLDTLCACSEYTLLQTFDGFGDAHLGSI